MGHLTTRTQRQEQPAEAPGRDVGHLTTCTPYIKVWFMTRTTYPVVVKLTLCGGHKSYKPIETTPS